MLRFLKWIFLVFGSLALLVMSFFFIQNKHDLIAAWENKGKLNYDELKKSCLNIKNEYYYPCLEKNFEDYSKLVSLTGTSIGLKMAFTFMDQDKAMNKLGLDPAELDVLYSLNYLKINNLALKNSYQQFFGLEFTYGGFVGKVKDNLDKASAFSDGIIDGLKGEKGIASVVSDESKLKYTAQLQDIEQDYLSIKQQIDSWLKLEIDKLEHKYGKLQ